MFIRLTSIIAAAAFGFVATAASAQTTTSGGYGAQANQG